MKTLLHRTMSWLLVGALCLSCVSAPSQATPIRAASPSTFHEQALPPGQVTSLESFTPQTKVSTFRLVALATGVIFMGAVDWYRIVKPILSHADPIKLMWL